MTGQASQPPLAYDRRGAAEAAGLSYDVIRQAINAGDLVEHKPIVAGRQLVKGVILRDELERWLTRAAPAA